MSNTTTMVEGDTLQDLVITDIDPPLSDGDTAEIHIKRKSDATRAVLAAVVVSSTEIRHVWTDDDTPAAGTYDVEYVITDAEGVQTGPTSAALTLLVRVASTAATA